MPSTTTEVSKILWKGPVQEGEVTEKHFEIVKSQSAPSKLESGDVEVQLIYISVDPYMRGRMRSAKGYFFNSFERDEPLASMAVGKIVESNNPQFQVGDFVSGLMNWATITIVKGGNGIHKLGNEAGVPLSYYLGVLGVNGLSAYAPLLRIGQPKKGETVLISAAAGGVGQIVGQICKNVYGCRVVGIAGTDAKVDFLRNTLNFDAAFNYKTIGSIEEGIKKHCQNGIDIYFDNVGGETLVSAIRHCNQHARIIACGMISDYNLEEKDRFPVRNLFEVVTKRIRMEGFLVGDYYQDMGLVGGFFRDMGQWISEGKVTVFEDVIQGFDQAPSAFRGLMKGDNIGKRVIQCAEDKFRK
ncbi:NADPH dependent alkenal/alkenone reductase [Paraphysoderma sedebokerense]|nr:NADPH dependent alkenal/alkenone reductase [Paraphysoderma sedebokerense]